MACTISSNPVQLVPTSVDHVIHVADNMREIDVRELQAFRITNVRNRLMSSYLVSDLCWTLLCEDVPVAIGGAAQIPGADGVGSPWFLATPTLELPAIRLALAFRSMQAIRIIQERYARLENWILADNVRTQSWLRWLGFWVSDPQDVEFATERVCLIVREREEEACVPPQQ